MNLERIVPLVLLTTCIYSLSFLLQEHTFLFPFPLYELAFLGVIIGYFIFDGAFRALKTTILLLVAAFVLALSSRFILEILCSDEQLEYLFHSPLVDVVQLSGILLFSAWAIVTYTSRTLKLVYLFRFSLIGYVIAWTFNFPLLGILFCGPLIYLLYLNRNQLILLHRHIWIAHLFFFFTKALMLLIAAN